MQIKGSNPASRRSLAPSPIHPTLLAVVRLGPAATPLQRNPHSTRGALFPPLLARSFPGGFRTPAPVPAPPLRWAGIRNPSQNSPCPVLSAGNKAPKADARAAAKCRPGEENLLRFVPADAINVRNARRLMPKHSPAAWGQPGGIRGCDGRADQAPACGLPGRQLRRADDDHARRHRSKGSASVARQGRRCHWAARGLRVKRNDLAPVRARASGASGRLGGGSRQYPQGRAHDDW